MANGMTPSPTSERFLALMEKLQVTLVRLETQQETLIRDNDDIRDENRKLREANDALRDRLHQVETRMAHTEGTELARRVQVNETTLKTHSENWARFVGWAIGAGVGSGVVSGGIAATLTRAVGG